MKDLKKVSIPLRCPSCKKEVIWDECYIGTDEALNNETSETLFKWLRTKSKVK